MNTYESKYCPRCSKAFDCKPGNIVQCQCFGIQLTSEQKTLIQDRYNDCLCKDCLLQLQGLIELFKDRLIPVTHCADH
ncbi:MAG: cysteine-rich CWC family protein [Bacteroidetes bacterium]|nr:cysteine-rich CWC family protein [Bacteroidota bacterium]